MERGFKNTKVYKDVMYGLISAFVTQKLYI